jgi:carnosine N-methyltransferase
LRTVARDWTCEGESERAQCYGPILDALERYFPDVEKRKSIHVLNPGCGLGRLPWEIAMRGFSCQGNEFSYFMLLVSHYILNYASNVPSASEEESKQHKIFPFIHQTTNVFKASDQIRSCSVPDVNPNDVALKDVDFSMTAGDWLEVYRDPEQPKRDVVVTCFFIDTAKNVLEFLEVISLILKDGGLWINLGPLLYHYADMENELSIELAYDEIKRLFPHFGFDILEEKSALECNYTWNKESMLKMAYKCVFSVCRKTSKKEEC